MDNNRNDINGSNRRSSEDRIHSDRNSRENGQAGNTARSSGIHNGPHSEQSSSHDEDKRTHSGSSSSSQSRRPDKKRAAKKRLLHGTLTGMPRKRRFLLNEEITGTAGGLTPVTGLFQFSSLLFRQPTELSEICT